MNPSLCLFFLFNSHCICVHLSSFSLPLFHFPFLPTFSSSCPLVLGSDTGFRFESSSRLTKYPDLHTSHIKFFICSRAIYRTIYKALTVAFAGENDKCYNARNELICLKCRLTMSEGKNVHCLVNVLYAGRSLNSVNDSLLGTGTAL